MFEELFDSEDKRRLNLSLATRERIIQESIKDKLPEDTSGRMFLISALDGMDRTILSKAKIKTSDAVAQAQQKTTEMMGDILLRFNNKTTATRTEKVRLSDSVEVTNPIEGETAIGNQELSYEAFIK